MTAIAEMTNQAHDREQPAKVSPPSHAMLRASSACKLAGMGESAFNTLRAQLEQALDLSGGLVPPPVDAAARKRVVLVAPALGGVRMPGRDWLYDAEVAAAYARGPRAVAPLMEAFVTAVRTVVRGQKSGERPRRARSAAQP